MGSELTLQSVAWATAVPNPAVAVDHGDRGATTSISAAAASVELVMMMVAPVDLYR